ncbi:hypothetical protein STEPF1_06230 [Streptomyces sp. F-1]|nr:hypothetical protein STEPF1_06230 [Streptomyces sp. F-1]
MRGRATSVTGSLKTKVQVLANKVLPDGVKAAVHRSMTEPGTGEEDGPKR